MSSDQQYCYEVSRASLDTSRIAVSLQEESGYQRDSCEASRKSPDTSSIAVKSLGRVLGPAG